MFCPCCNNKMNKVKSWTGGYMKCVRDHMFKVDMVDGQRKLVVVKSPDEGCSEGQTFPVPDEEMFAD